MPCLHSRDFLSGQLDDPNRPAIGAECEAFSVRMQNDLTDVN